MPWKLLPSLRNIIAESRSSYGAESDELVQINYLILLWINGYESELGISVFALG